MDDDAALDAMLDGGPVASPDDSPEGTASAAASPVDGDGQVDAGGERVAPEADPANAGAADEPTDQAAEPDVSAATAPTEPTEPTTQNWDDPANPHYAAAQRFAEVQAAAAEMARRQAEEKRIEGWQAGFEKLADGNIPDDDLPRYANALIADIQQHAADPVTAQLTEQGQQFGRLQQSTTALVMAMQDALPADLQEKVKARAAQLREFDTLPAMQQQVSLKKQMETETQAALKTMQDKIDNLTAQLTGTAQRDSGVFRTETVTHGAANGGPADDLDDYLSGGRW
ncbi:hypothetical protein [Iamia sp.]|uniref:hypothetical protein n=1 Tax=Iamia sp. TaxID=2722710 RepID=UPI002BC34253|nr:hypothetical protein [Iamia sp.]HXH59316.1 hypothetical protein [Iamia sp.]